MHRDIDKLLIAWRKCSFYLEEVNIAHQNAYRCICIIMHFY